MVSRGAKALWNSLRARSHNKLSNGKALPPRSGVARRLERRPHRPHVRRERVCLCACAHARLPSNFRVGAVTSRRRCASICQKMSRCGLDACPPPAERHREAVLLAEGISTALFCRLTRQARSPPPLCHGKSPHFWPPRLFADCDSVAWLLCGNLRPGQAEERHVSQAPCAIGTRGSCGDDRRHHQQVGL